MPLCLKTQIHDGVIPKDLKLVNKDVSYWPRLNDFDDI